MILQKTKIIAVGSVAAVIIVAFIGYEFITANSPSGYTKLTLIASQPNSVKFGNDDYGLIYSSPNGYNIFVFSVPTTNSSESFNAIKEAKYNFSGLQILVGNVNSNQLILYVKPTNSNFEPMISPMTTSTVSPFPTLLIHQQNQATQH